MFKPGALHLYDWRILDIRALNRTQKVLFQWKKKEHKIVARLIFTERRFATMGAFKRHESRNLAIGRYAHTRVSFRSVNLGFIFVAASRASRDTSVDQDADVSLRARASSMSSNLLASSTTRKSSAVPDYTPPSRPQKLQRWAPKHRLVTRRRNDFLYAVSHGANARLSGDKADDIRDPRTPTHVHEDDIPSP